MIDDIYDTIIAYITAHGYPPTLKEIGAAVGLKSTATVHLYLEMMRHQGIIETDAPGKSRAIRIPGTSG